MKCSVVLARFRLCQKSLLFILFLLCAGYLSAQITPPAAAFSHLQQQSVRSCEKSIDTVWIRNTTSGSWTGYMNVAIDFGTPAVALSSFSCINGTTTAVAGTISGILTPTAPTTKYVVTISGINLPAGKSIRLLYGVDASCSLLQDPINSRYPFLTAGAGSTYPRQLSVQYSGDGGSSSASFVVRMLFPFINISLAQNLMSPPCAAVSMGDFGVVTATPELHQSFSSYPSIPGTICRAITLKNNGSDFEFTTNRKISVADVRVESGLVVTDIAKCAPGAASILTVRTGSGKNLYNITRGSTYKDSILIDRATFRRIVDSPLATKFWSGQEITFYEILTPTIDNAESVCGKNILSNLECNWPCPDGATAYIQPNPPGFCVGTLIGAYMDFPMLNAALIQTITSTPVNPCYNETGGAFSSLVSTHTYDVKIMNAGNRAASNIEVRLGELHSDPAIGWTDLDLSPIYNSGAYNTTNFTIGAALAPRKILPADVALVTGSISNTAYSAPLGRTISIQLQPGVLLGPGEELHLRFSSYTRTPTSCGENSMDQCEIRTVYKGKCNGTNGEIPMQYIEPTGKKSIFYHPLGFLSGPLHLVGRAGVTSYPSPSVYSYLFPNEYSNSNNLLWPNESTAGHLSFLVRIELGTDIKPYQSVAAPGTLAAQVQLTTSTGIPILPTCVNYIGGFSISGRNVIEARFDNAAINDFKQALLTLKLEPHCDLGADAGMDPLIVGLYEVPKTTCSALPACSSSMGNRVPLACSNELVNVVCPGCHIAGIYSDGVNQPMRESYGDYDADDDNLSDGIPVTMNIHSAFTDPDPNKRYAPQMTCAFPVKTTEMMYSDVFRVRTFENVQADANVEPSLTALMAGTGSPALPGFPFVFARLKFTPGGSPALSNPINFLSQYDGGAGSVTRAVELRWWLDGYVQPGMVAPGGVASLTPLWSNPIYVNMGPDDIYKNTVTGEFCYRIPATAIKALDATFPGVINGLHLVIDFNYKVTDNVGAGEPYPVVINSTVYGGFRDESFTNPATWLVHMQDDPNFGSVAYLHDLCQAPFNVRTRAAAVGLGYSYDSYPLSVPANATVASCADVRWFCVPGVSTIRLAGFQWTGNIWSNPMTSINSCNLYERMDRFFNVGSMVPYSYSNEFRKEYRNWTYQKSISFLTNHPAAANYQLVLNAEPKGWETWINIVESAVHGSTPYPIVPPTILSPFRTIDMASASYSTWPRLPGQLYSRTDDGYYAKNAITVKLACNWPRQNIVVRWANVYPPNHLSIQNPSGGSVINTTVGSLYDLIPDEITSYSGFPTPPVGNYTRYSDRSDTLIPPTPYPLVIQGAVNPAPASCGKVTWTETVTVPCSKNNFVVNPFVGFTGLGAGWTITSVKINGVALTYDPLLEVYLKLQTPSMEPFEMTGPTGSPPAQNNCWISYNSNTPRYQTNTVTVEASYCPNTKPATNPIMYIGSLCDILELRTTVPPAIDLSETNSAFPNKACVINHNELVPIYNDPIPLVTEREEAPAGCTDAFYKTYVIKNTGHGYLGNIRLHLDFAAGAAYTTGPTAEMTYNSIVTSIPVSSGTDITLSGVLLPGTQDLTPLSTQTDSLIIRIPIVAGCPTPTNAVLGFSVQILSDNICVLAPTASGCNEATYVFNEGPYQLFNNLITVPGMPPGATPEACNGAYQVNIEIDNNGGSSVIHPGNNVHFFLPAGSIISSVDFDGTVVPATGAGAYNSVATSVGGLDEYIYPLPLTATPGSSVLHISFTVPHPFCNNQFRSQWHYTCDICDLSENLVSYTLPLPTITVSQTGECAPVSLQAGTICDHFNYNWSDHIAFTSTSNPTDVTASGNYTVTVSDGSCSTTAAHVASILPAPNVTITASALEICAGQQVTLTALSNVAASDYEWATTPDGPAISTNATTLFSPSITTTYYVRVSSNGCSSTQAVTIVVHSLPNAEIVAAQSTICYGGAGVDLQATPVSTDATYLWSDGATTSLNHVNPAANTTYSVTITENNCSAVAAQTITVNHPSLSISPFSANVLCGVPITIYAHAIGEEPLTYVWSLPGNPSAGTASSLQITPVSGSPVLPAQVIVTDPHHCSVTGHANLQVAMPTATLSPSASICMGEQVTLSATGGSDYSWSSNTGLSGTSNTSTVNVAPTVTSTYTVTVSGFSGCSATAAATITVNPLLHDEYTITADVPQPVAGGCLNEYEIPLTINGNNVLGNAATLNVQMPSGYELIGFSDGIAPMLAPHATSFSYNIPNGASLPLHITLKVRTSMCAGTVTASIIVVASCGSVINRAFEMNEEVIEVQPSIDLVQTGSCSSLTQTGPYVATLAVNRACSENDLTYSWSPVVSSDRNTVNPSGPSATSVLLASNGTYSVTVADASGCAVTAAATVSNIHPMMVTTSTGHGDCNTIVTIPRTPGLIGGSAPYSFVWSDLDGAHPNFTTATIPSAIAAFLPGVRYSVVVTDANNCTANGASFGLWPSPPLTTEVHFGEMISGCQNVLEARLECGVGGYQYLWSDGSTADRIVNPAPGSYSVTITDLGNSSATYTGSHSVWSVAPVVANLETLQPDCYGSTAPHGSIRLTAFDDNLSGYRSFSYHWSSVPAAITTAGTTFDPTIAGSNMNNLSNLSIGASNSLTVTDVISGLPQGTYTVTVTDISTGCSATATTTVELDAVQPLITVSSPEICKGGTVSFNAAASTCTHCSAIVSYQWNGPPAVSGSLHTAVLVAAPEASGTYSVTITDNHQCSATATTPVMVSTPQLTLAADVNSICNGSSATLSAAPMPPGSPAVYSYNWSDGLGFVTANNQTVWPTTTTTYSVTAMDISTALSCTVSENITIAVTVPVAAISPLSLSVCPGAEISLSGIGRLPGGSVPQLEWTSPGMLPILTDVLNTQVPNSGGPVPYTLTVSDPVLSGCSATAVLNVLVDDLLPQISAVDMVCPGTSVMLSVTCVSCSSAPFSYQWAGGNIHAPSTTSAITLTPDEEAVYAVTVTNSNGCNAVATKSVNVDTEIDPGAIITNASSGNCDGEIVITPSGGVPPYVISWYDQTTATAGLPTSTSPASATLSCIPGGRTYLITITDAIGCSLQTTAAVNSTGISGGSSCTCATAAFKTAAAIVETNTFTGTQMELLPNPANDWAIVSYSLNEPLFDTRIVVRNMLGQEVISIKLNALHGEHPIDLSRLPADVYNVSIEDSQHRIATRRLVKQ